MTPVPMGPLYGKIARRLVAFLIVLYDRVNISFAALATMAAYRSIWIQNPPGANLDYPLFQEPKRT